MKLTSHIGMETLLEGNTLVYLPWSKNFFCDKKIDSKIWPNFTFLNLSNCEEFHQTEGGGGFRG